MYSQTWEDPNGSNESNDSKHSHTLVDSDSVEPMQNAMNISQPLFFEDSSKDGNVSDMMDINATLPVMQVTKS